MYEWLNGFEEEPIEQAGLLVVMSWNTDRTDIDLHVREPSGTEVYYSHPNSVAGGHLTRNFKLDRKGIEASLLSGEFAANQCRLSSNERSNDMRGVSHAD